MTKVSAMFDTHGEAERAVSELKTLGLGDSDLSVIAHHAGTTTTQSGNGEITEEYNRGFLRGILGGGALGAGLGIAALAIPGVGPLVAAGAIAASAIPTAAGIGAAIGAVAGTFNEALTTHGISDVDAIYYSGRVRDEAVIVTVEDTGIEPDSLYDVLYRNGGHNGSRPSTTSLKAPPQR